MARRKTHEEFLKEVYEINPDVDVLDVYVNASTKMRFYCKKHDYQWECSPNQFLTSHGCPICRGVKDTPTTFKERVELCNGKITLLSDYVENVSKMKVKCKTCGYEWESLPSNILKGRGCPKCSKCYKCTHEEFVDKLFEEYGDEYSVIGNYIDSKTKIKLRHNICGHEFDSVPSKILHKADPRRCPKCFGGVKSTNDEFIKKVFDLVSDEYTFLEEYINSSTKIKCKHNKCEYEYMVSPNDFLSGHRCPSCNQSKGEIKCQKYFENNNINYIPQKSFDGLVGLGGKLLSYDFYLPEFNLLIEYQGEFHDGKANKYVSKNLKKQQEHDKRKREYATLHNIELLEIWYWDYENTEQILESRLLKQSA